MDIFGSITGFLGMLLGWLMRFIYNIIPNYGIALFVFTLITRVFLIPISINQQKSTAKMSVIQPKVNALREKYGKDNQKLNEEVSKLYQKEGYNPAGGCLPMIVQFVLLFGLIDVVYKPLTHILRLDKGLIQNGIKLFGLLGGTAASANMMELEFTKALIDKPVFFASMGTAAIEAIKGLDYTFLGMDLMLKPSFSMITGIFSGGFNPVVLIPILSGITAFLSSKVAMSNTPQTAAANDPTAASMKSMMYMMPLMSVWIAFTVPAGVGLYWVYSNIFMIIQSKVMYKFFNPEKLKEQAALEAEKRHEVEEVERAKKKEELLETGLLDDSFKDKKLSKKDVENIKLAAARKRDEEKYGDE